MDSLTSHPEQFVRLAGAGAAFVLVAALWVAVMVVWSMRRGARDRTVQERLGLLAPAAGRERTLRLWREGRDVTTTVPGTGASMSLAQRIRRAHYQAGLGLDIAPPLMGLAGGCVLLLFGGWFLTGNPIVAVAGPALLLMGYTGWVSGRARKRWVVFEQQFVHALELAARSLRAGHPLLGSFQLIADELEPPVKTTFAEVCQQHAMGVSLEGALERVAAASSSADLKLFSTSVAIQLRSGGNLADMMERLAAVIRDRMRLGRRIRVLTSQTQFSKRILVGMPIVLFLALSIVNPTYVATLYKTTEGNVLLGIGGSLLVIGVFAMNRMAVLRY